MARPMKMTSSVPFTVLFVALLLCTVAESYHTAATRYRVSGRFAQMPSFNSIQSRKSNIETLHSFTSLNSISQSQTSVRKVSFSSMFQLLVEKARSLSTLRGKAASTLFQKCAVICTLFLSTFLGKSQRVFAATAPLIKNVKVCYHLITYTCRSF